MATKNLGKTIAEYIDAIIETIEETVVLEPSDVTRLQNDLETEISERLGDSPTLEELERELGSVADWAKNFTDASDLPKATHSANYVNRKTKTKLFGLPLLHVAFGVKNDKRQTARGIVAVGDSAVGVFAFGGMARGIFAFGGFSMGLITFGGFSLGLLLAMGGFAIAPVVWGGFGLGFFSMSGFAIGYYAIGGFAVGHTAIGGVVYAIEGLGGGLMHVQTVLDKSHWMCRFFESYYMDSILTMNILVVFFVMMFLSVQGIAWRWGRKKN